MFLGEYKHTIDDKGRIIIPSKFREQLAQGVVITRGLDQCLFVFAYEDWKKFVTILNEQLSFTQRSARDFSRFFFSGATDIIPDRQGRVLIPSFLRAYAGLGTDVVVIGANTRLELWNSERWAQVLQDVESNAANIAEQFEHIIF